MEAKVIEPRAPERHSRGSKGDRLGSEVTESNTRLSPNAQGGRLATSRFSPVVCATCGRSVERAARQQKFCSDSCRERSRRRSRKLAVERLKMVSPSGDTGAPTDPLKNTSKNNNLRRPKSGSSPLKIDARGWQAPARVIEAHFPPSAETVSAHGVASFVAHLRPRALVSAGGSR
jgi:hypothetical protein